MSIDKKILIIDAHPVYGPKIQAFLEGLTFRNIEIINKGSQAFERTKTFSPDLVILSGMLPDADSLETLKSIKTIRPSLPVIVQVGLLAEDALKKSFQTAGACAVLPRLEKDLFPLQNAIETNL